MGRMHYLVLKCTNFQGHDRISLILHSGIKYRMQLVVGCI